MPNCGLSGGHARSIASSPSTTSRQLCFGEPDSRPSNSSASDRFSSRSLRRADTRATWPLRSTPADGRRAPDRGIETSRPMEAGPVSARGAHLALAASSHGMRGNQDAAPAFPAGGVAAAVEQNMRARRVNELVVSSDPPGEIAGPTTPGSCSVNVVSAGLLARRRTTACRSLVERLMTAGASS
jgi:hypothetical protein